jgi:uncharacterized protein (TIGR03067 family)
MDDRPMPFGCLVAAAPIFFALTVVFVVMLVVEMRFGSRALSAEAAVVEVGSAPDIIFMVPLDGRHVLIRCDKLPHDVVVQWGWDVPQPGDPVAILYEPDPQRIDPNSHIPGFDLKGEGTNRGVKLNSFWRRYFLPLLFLLLSGGATLVMAANIVINLHEKWQNKAEAGKKEIAELQGTWKLQAHEEQGIVVPPDDTQLVTITGDKISWKRKGEVIEEGTIELDATRSPKHLNYQFNSGRSDPTIYIRVGDYFVQCGRRNGKTRPSEFATGTANGGEYLIVLKREK